MQLLRDVYLVSGRHFFNTSGSNVADCNVYAVRTSEGIILVDCGYDDNSVAMIDRNLAYWGMNPKDIKYIFLTHSHFDHTGACRAFKERGAKLVAHPTVAEALARGDERTIHYAFMRGDFPTCSVDKAVDDGDRIQVGDWTFDVLNVPGHTEGNLIFVTEKDGRRIMFTGDFVFHERPLTTDETIAWNGGTEFDTDKFLESLLRVQRIRADALLPGHYGFLLYDGATIVDRALVVALRAWGNKFAERREVADASAGA